MARPAALVVALKGVESRRNEMVASARGGLVSTLRARGALARGCGLGNSIDSDGVAGVVSAFDGLESTLVAVAVV